MSIHFTIVECMVLHAENIFLLFAGVNLERVLK